MLLITLIPDEKSVTRCHFFFPTKLVKFFYRETVKEIVSLLVLLGKALKYKSTEIKVTATRPPNHQLSEFSQDLNTSVDYQDLFVDQTSNNEYKV